MPSIPALSDGCKHQLFDFLTDLDSKPHVNQGVIKIQVFWEVALCCEPFLSGSSSTMLQEPRTSHTITTA